MCIEIALKPKKLRASKHGWNHIDYNLQVAVRSVQIEVNGSGKNDHDFDDTNSCLVE